MHFLYIHYKKKLKYRRNIIDRILFVGKIPLSTDLTDGYYLSLIIDRFTDEFNFVCN